MGPVGGGGAVRTGVKFLIFLLPKSMITFTYSCSIGVTLGFVSIISVARRTIWSNPFIAALLQKNYRHGFNGES